MSLSFNRRAACKVVVVACRASHWLSVCLATLFVLGAGTAAAQTGTISGTVTNASGGAPLSGISVRVYSSANVQVAVNGTNALGVYTSAPLAPGSYFVRTSNTLGYVDEVYDNVPWVSNSSNPLGMPVTVVAGVTTPGINFALAQGGRISGTVTTPGAISGLGIQVYSSTGVFVLGGISTDATGFYTSGGLPAGNYFVRTSNTLGFIDEIYNDIVFSASVAVITSGMPVTVTVGAITTGIDFALAQGGRISGTVTNATAQVMSGVGVQVYSSTGVIVGGTITTSATGTYTSGGLPAGTYHVRTSNTLGYVDEVYDNVLFVSNTASLPLGMPVAVTVGATTPGIDFALAQGGTISGTVTRTSDGQVLSGISVRVYSDPSVQVLSITTNASGVYTSSGLPPGDYYVRTSNTLGFLDEVYDNVPFVSNSASLPLGALVTVAVGATTTGIDFALDQGGSISGTVTNTSTGLPISGITVNVYPKFGPRVGGATTGASGVYAINMPAGTYFLRSSNSLGFIDKAFDNVVPGPDAVFVNSGGTPLTVMEAETRTGIDFALSPGGQITGRVTDAASNGIGGVTIEFIDPRGIGVSSLRSTTTSASGNYSTAGLSTGTYFLRASASSTTAYITELYDDVTCAPCSFLTGTPIEVTLGEVTGNINFVLAAGGRISGTVKDSTTLVPLIGVGVDVSTATVGAAGERRDLFNFVTDAAGSYATSGLPPGTYFAAIRSQIAQNLPPASQGYAGEVYDGVQCSGCNRTTGTPIEVGPNEFVGNIDFLLAPGTRLAGHVQDGQSLAPMGDASVSLFSSTGLLAAVALTDQSGDYVLGVGLNPGTYYAVYSARMNDPGSVGYLSQRFSGLPCGYDPFLVPAACAPTGGTKIVVPGAGDVDFSVQRGGRISGSVTDAVTGAALFGVTVTVYDSTGTAVGSAKSGTAGLYRTLGLVPGTYYVHAIGTTGYVSEVHPNTPCLGCNPSTAGSAVTVTQGNTATVNFALDKGGRVAGTVTADGGGPLQGVTVEVFTAPYALPAASGTTGGSGTYLTSAGLPDGSYRVRTQNSLGYVNERFDSIPCVENCTPLAGDDPVGVATPAITPDIDFSLDLDADPDADGIPSSIDPDSVYSGGFSDVPQGGLTVGTIVDRGGWDVTMMDIAPGGVQALLSGSGGSEAKLHTCPAGNPEEVWLDQAGEAATLLCVSGTGSTTVKALAAAPIIELRKTVVDVTTVVQLTTGQTATLGSPVVADPENVDALHITVLDNSGPIASFALDPGESAEVAKTASGALSATAFEGAVDVTIGGVDVALGPGEAALAQPDGLGLALCSALEIHSVTASPDVLWPANHKMVTVRLSPSLLGACGTTTFQIMSVISNEPDNGLGDGDTAMDWEIVSGLTLKLRAERAGNGPGRVYTVVIRGTDETGRTADKTVTVSVPRNR